MSFEVCSLYRYDLTLLYQHGVIYRDSARSTLIYKY